MRFTKKALQQKIDQIFGQYTDDESLKEFNILHMYRDNKPCMFYDNGFVDMQNFQLIAYNTDTRKKRDLSNHDALFPCDCKVKNICIFMDGSTMVKFKHFVSYDVLTQALYLVPVKDAN